MNRILSLAAGLLVACSFAQAQSALPAAPGPRLLPVLQTSAGAGEPMHGSAGSSGSGQTAANGSPQLSLSDAEQMAILNNPRVTVGKLMALAQHQAYRQALAAELPTATAAVTGVEAEEATRISAGSLTASRLFEHAGAGVSFTQLIYDFGHTHNLVLSSKLAEKASDANALATIEEIVLATDQAFYDALNAQALLRVAEQTVSTRQTTDQQVKEMTRNKLKSTLDLSFADVNLSQAQLLKLDAQDNADASMAVLDSVLGLDHNVQYDLVEDSAAPPPPPASAEPLIHLALLQRPDLQALNYDTQSAHKYTRAEWDQLLPSISAAGTAGVVPVRPDQYYVTNWWGAVGGNVNIPVFNGFLYNAEAREAKYREQAAAENSRDLRDQIVRDVTTSWLQANTAWQRLAVTEQLVQEADLAMKLAQTRYQMGLSSIVALSQAQLQQTDAQIQNASARYQYRLALSTLNYEIGQAP